jgi:VWFA-related protein
MACLLRERLISRLKSRSASILSCALCLAFPAILSAQTQPPPPTPSQQPSAPAGQKPDSKSSSDEIVSHDTPATFKVRVNLVLVRVVVRDSKGKVVKDLKQDDFQLTDNRKIQAISTFSVETPGSQVPAVKMDSTAATPEGTPVKAPDLPQRFVTLFFDDLHLSTQDSILSRQAGLKLLEVMGPSDRLSIFTTSGQVNQEYTSDREVLSKALLRIVPRPLNPSSSFDCPPMTFYEAYQIVEANDPLALQVATAQAASCAGPGAANLAQAAAQRELSLGETQIQFSLGNLESLIRRMTGLPGQRVIVMMSPGFFVTPTMHQTSDLIDRATKANIVINTIDSRGLYVSSVFDASNPGNNLAGNAGLNALLTQFITIEESAQDDILAEFADGTGGTFFHNRNDIDQGLLQAATEPEVSYVLGFAPQNLKLDGKFHRLRVTLVNKQRWSLQARHGYFAPKGEVDPAAQAKEEIQQAIFSQDELHELPIECQTQFFKNSDGVHLSVVTHLDTKPLRFRKAEDRNNENIVVSTAIFDENGNLITGQQKTLELRLKDGTLDRINKTGLRVKSTFDIQPGTFLVRVVVRDSEGAQMAAMTRGVVIP